MMRRILTSGLLYSAVGVAASNSIGAFKATEISYPFCGTRSIATSMKAVRVSKFGDANELQVFNQDVPEPKPTEVLVKVEAVGINPVEILIRKGWFGDMIKTPYIPGSDIAGTVEYVGEKVTRFKRGDRVFAIKTTSGAYAEYCTAPMEYVSPLARRLSFSQGAAIGVPYTAAYKALFLRAKPKRGDTVFVHGASGAVGMAAVQMAKSKGYKVIGTAGTHDGMQVVRDCGADLVFNHQDHDYIDKIKKATGNKGVNVILEMMANKNLVADLSIIAPKGRIVVIGNAGSIPQFDPAMLMGTEANVMGMIVQTSTLEEYQEMLSAINQGQTTWVKPLIANEYPLEEAAQAHKDLESGDGTIGKRVLKPQEMREGSPETTCTGPCPAK